MNTFKALRMAGWLAMAVLVTGVTGCAAEYGTETEELRPEPTEQPAPPPPPATPETTTTITPQSTCGWSGYWTWNTAQYKWVWTWVWYPCTTTIKFS